MFFLLPDSLKGFATNKRLIASLANDVTAASNDVTAAILTKYRAGSEHLCRVLDYNRLSSTYVVTTDARAVNEQTFASRDLRAGQAVRVRVRAVKEEGAVVECGHVTGFVTNAHLSNALYASATKRKFSQGQRLDAR